MSEGFIRVPRDADGKRCRAIKRTVDGMDVYEEVAQEMTRGIAEVPPDKQTTKITIGEDIEGNVREVTAFDGVEQLFKIIISKAGNVVDTYDIIRQ